MPSSHLTMDVYMNNTSILFLQWITLSTLITVLIEIYREHFITSKDYLCLNNITIAEILQQGLYKQEIDERYLLYRSVVSTPGRGSRLPNQTDLNIVWHGTRQHVTIPCKCQMSSYIMAPYLQRKDRMRMTLNLKKDWDEPSQIGTKSN